jgi:group I intron endonuclease
MDFLFMGNQDYRRYVGVYSITNPLGYIYIGSSVDIKSRWRDHRGKLSKSIRRLHESFITYGINSHVFEMIELCNKDELPEKERYWQEYYNVISDKGLNAKYRSTKEKKEIICKQTREILSKMNKGKKHQKEFGEKISKAKKGIKTYQIPASSKIVFDLVNGIYYNSAMECALLNNISVHKLRAMLTGITRNKTNFSFV